MKLATLLAQYLYNYKQLILPGIGTFTLDPAVHIEQDNPRNKTLNNIEGVDFESNPSIEGSPGLIQYISSETGKIKALAAADLDSHLGLALQFINIGKPFLFEGIGSLSKINAGGFAFTPGHVINTKTKESTSRETEKASVSEEPATEYKSVFNRKNPGGGMKLPGVVLLIIAGIGLAIWGGYMVYKKSVEKESPEVIQSENTDIEVLPESSSPLNDSSIDRRDSALPVPVQVARLPAGNYKFIVEVSDKARALQRVATLKGYGININMESVDSINYKLFFILPSVPADTARIMDSLRIHYTPPGKKAFIE